MRRKKFTPMLDLMEKRTLLTGSVLALTPGQVASVTMELSDQVFSMFQRTASGTMVNVPMAAMPVISGSILHLTQIMLGAPKDAAGNTLITPEIQAKLTGIHAGEYAAWTATIARSSNPAGLAELLGWSYKTNPDGSFIITFPTGVETAVSVDVIASTNGTFQGPTMDIKTWLPDGSTIEVQGDTSAPDPITIIVVPSGLSGLGSMAHVAIKIPSPVAEEPPGYPFFSPDMFTSALAPMVIPVIPFDPRAIGLPIIPMLDIDEFPDPFQEIFPDPFPIPQQPPQSFQFLVGSVVDPNGYVWSPVGQYNPNIGATNTYAPYAPSTMPADYSSTQAYSLAINGVGYNATDGFYSLPLANPISGDLPFILPNQLVPPTAPPTGQLD